MTTWRQSCRKPSDKASDDCLPHILPAGLGGTLQNKWLRQMSTAVLSLYHSSIWHAAGTLPLEGLLFWHVADLPLLTCCTCSFVLKDRFGISRCLVDIIYGELWLWFWRFAPGKLPLATSWPSWGPGCVQHSKITHTHIQSKNANKVLDREQNFFLENNQGVCLWQAVSWACMIAAVNRKGSFGSCALARSFASCKQFSEIGRPGSSQCFSGARQELAFWKAGLSRPPGRRLLLRPAAMPNQPSL